MAAQVRRFSRARRIVAERRLRARGISFAQIGQRMGVRHTTVMRDLGPPRDRPTRAGANRSRLDAEPRWCQWFRLPGKPPLWNEVLRSLRVDFRYDFRRVDAAVKRDTRLRVKAHASLQPMCPVDSITFAYGSPPSARAERDSPGWWEKILIDVLKGEGLLSGEDSVSTFPRPMPFFRVWYPDSAWSTTVVMEGVSP